MDNKPVTGTGLCPSDELRTSPEPRRRAEPSTIIRVLLVEDSTLDTYLIRSLLAKAGHDSFDLEYADRLSTALERLDEGGIDVVLLDLLLPDSQGLDTFIQAHTYAPHVPILVLTSFGDESLGLQAVQAGAQDYLFKWDFDDTLMARAIKYAIERQRLEEELKELMQKVERAKREWESTADSLPELICLVDERGHIMRANRTVETWNLAQVVDVKGREFHQLLHPHCTGSSCYLDCFWKEAWAEALQGQPAQCEAYDQVLERRVLIRIQPWTGADIGSTVVIVHDISERKRAEEELRQSYAKLRRTLEGTINALVSAVEMRDPYTAGHQWRVAQLACAIAKEMGLSEDQVNGLYMAAMIHDLGKINVPAEILSKPGRLSEIELSLIKTHPQVGHDILNVPAEVLSGPGRLSEMELSLIKVHPQIGYDVLKRIEFPWPVAQIVLQHHERMDGSGYPQGLSGEEILLEARILAVADVVEAMSSHRPYRPAHGIEEALEEISQNRGILYDAEVVGTCLELFTEKGFSFW